MKIDITPICPYCGKFSEKTTGQVLFPKKEYLANKVYYACKPCRAFVGTLPDKVTPMGRLSNAELRKNKKFAYDAFDRIIKDCVMVRSTLVRRLSDEMKISIKDFNIGALNLAEVSKVTLLCEDIYRQAKLDTEKMVEDLK